MRARWPSIETKKNMIPHGMYIEKYRHDAARQQQAKQLAAAARSITPNENVAVGAFFALAATEN